MSGSVQVDDTLHARLEWLHPNEGGGDGDSKVLPKTLYIDDRTVLEEVRDITALRKGDHCIVGLNALRKMHWVFDWLSWWLSKWGMLRVYHHFLMMDDVASVELKCGCSYCIKIDTPGSPIEPLQKCINIQGPVPIAPNGTYAMICEYSNTPARASSILFNRGPSIDCWKQMAPFQKLPLADYVHDSGTEGIFRVVRDQPLTTLELQQIMLQCEKLMNSYEPYNFFWRNCESVCFALNPKANKWITPEVPMMLWSLFRICLGMIGVLCLFYIRDHGSHTTFDICQTIIKTFTNENENNNNNNSEHDERDHENVMIENETMILQNNSNNMSDNIGCSFQIALKPIFHFFVTIPIGLQLLIHLVRSTVHLTNKRLSLGEQSFHHLLAKEVGRSIVVGMFCLYTLSHIPNYVNETKTIWISCFITLCGFTFANSFYGVLSRGSIEIFKRTIGGVPVVTFVEGVKDGVMMTKSKRKRNNRRNRNRNNNNSNNNPQCSSETKIDQK